MCSIATSVFGCFDMQPRSFFLFNRILLFTILLFPRCAHSRSPSWMPLLVTSLQWIQRIFPTLTGRRPIFSTIVLIRLLLWTIFLHMACIWSSWDCYSLRAIHLWLSRSFMPTCHPRCNFEKTSFRNSLDNPSHFVYRPFSLTLPSFRRFPATIQSPLISIVLSCMNWAAVIGH